MSVNLGRVAYVEQGAYDSGTTYQKKDVVSYNNGSYVYIADAPAAGIVPTDSAYWQPMLDPASMNQAVATANQAAETANQAANAATTAANAANTAAEAADEARLAISDELNKKAPAIYVDASGDMVHITDGAEGMPVKSLITHVEPKQEGSGDPSPNNVRPISGWDEVGVNGAGKNLCIKSSITSQEHPTGRIEIKNIKKHGVYTLSAQITRYADDTATYSRMAIIAYYTDGTNKQVNGETDVNLSETDGKARYKTVTITTDSTKEIDYFALHPLYYSNHNGRNAKAEEIQFERGSTATAYEPYQGQTLTDDLPETVYGGKRNWTTGGVTSTKRMYQFTGEETLRITSSGYFQVVNADNPAIRLREAVTNTATKNIVCSHYSGCAYDEFGVGKVVLFAGGVGTTVTFGASGFADASAFKAYLAAQYNAGSPVTIVFDLLPEYWKTLTPGEPQQLFTLKGTNNIWSDAGATEVTYAADTKLYIDGKIAAIAAAIV